MLFSGVGNSVGKSGFNAPSDIGSVKKGLSLSGDWNPMVEMYDHPTSGPAKTFETGLEGLQDRFGLKKDGLMKPGGPTELTLKSETARNSVDQFSRKVPSLVGLSDGVGFGQKNKPNDVKSMTTLLGGMGAPSLSAPKAPTPPKLDQAPKAGLGHVLNKGAGGDLTRGGLFQTVPQTPSVMDMAPNAQIQKEPYLPSFDPDPGSVVQQLPYRSPSPNGALIDAIKWFQTQFGLEPDGVMRPDGPSIGLLDRLLSPILGAGVLDPSLVGGPSPAKPKQPVFGPWGVEYPDGHFDGDGIFVADDQGYEPEIWFDDYGSPKKVSFEEYTHHHQGKPPLWHENAEGLIEMNGEFKSEVVPMVAAVGYSSAAENDEPELMKLRASNEGAQEPAGEVETNDPGSVQVAQASGQASGASSPTSANANSPYPPLFHTYRSQLAPREGGIANRPKSADPGGLTNKGMSQQALNSFRLDPKWAHLPATSDKLTDAQIDEVFYHEYFERPQIGKLAAVPGLASAAPQLAEQIFDSGVLHGPEDAGRWLQESIDQAMGTNLKVPDPTNPNGPPHYDGIIGSGTRAALERAVAAGKAKEINNLIVQKRLAYLQTLKNYKQNKGGWEPRAKSFLIP